LVDRGQWGWVGGCILSGTAYIVSCDVMYLLLVEGGEGEKGVVVLEGGQQWQNPD